jgi:hypothetical protein
MPTYEPRVCIPSREGTYVRKIDEDSFLVLNPAGAFSYNAPLLAVSWTALLADSPSDPVKPNRVIHRFVSDVSTDIIGLIRSYAALFDELADSLANSRVIGDISTPSLLAKFKRTPIFREYLEFCRSGSAPLLKYILTFLLFGKKVFYEDENLDTIALRKWEEVERRLDELILPAFVPGLQKIVDWIMSGWNSDYFLPKHGGGAVAEPKIRGIHQKNSAIAFSKQLNYVYRSNSLFLVNEPNDAYSPSTSSKEVESNSQAAKLIFVPKDIGSSRSICMEPIAYQWAQQGVRLWYEKALLSGPIGKNIPLHDQTVSQDAACYGSLTSLVDTIDLSSASDSVAWSLVKAIFPSKVLKHLVATRTTTVRLPDGRLVKPNKFAPMGSALCFPVQSTVYASVVVLVGIAWRYGIPFHEVLLRREDDLQFLFDTTFADTLGSGSDTRLQPFYIYGDDIICDSRITSNVIRALNMLGFSVNAGKSFTGDSGFRESCGGYYYRGHDVIPLRFKTKAIRKKMNMEAVAGLTDLANRAYDYGLLNLRRHLVQFLLHYPIIGVRGKVDKNPILFSDSRELGHSIYAPDASNRHLKQRLFDPEIISDQTHSRFQRDEVRSLTSGPIKFQPHSVYDEHYKYTQWWRSRYYMADSLEQRTVAIDPDTSGVEPEIRAELVAADPLRQGTRWRWTPTG